MNPEAFPPPPPPTPPRGLRSPLSATPSIFFLRLPVWMGGMVLLLCGPDRTAGSFFFPWPARLIPFLATLGFFPRLDGGLWRPRLQGVFFLRPFLPYNLSFPSPSTGSEFFFFFMRSTSATCSSLIFHGRGPGGSFLSLPRWQGSFRRRIGSLSYDMHMARVLHVDKRFSPVCRLLPLTDCLFLSSNAAGRFSSRGRFFSVVRLMNQRGFRRFSLRRWTMARYVGYHSFSSTLYASVLGFFDVPSRFSLFFKERRDRPSRYLPSFNDNPGLVVPCVDLSPASGDVFPFSSSPFFFRSTSQPVAELSELTTVAGGNAFFPCRNESRFSAYTPPPPPPPHHHTTADRLFDQVGVPDARLSPRISARCFPVRALGRTPRPIFSPGKCLFLRRSFLFLP